MTGPVTNNYGTELTTYLGDDRVGMLHEGRRWVAARGKLERVGASDAPALTGVLRHGNAYLFAGPGGLYSAPAFDGPLLLLSSTVDSFQDVAPRAVNLGGTLISTETGKPIPGTPNDAREALTHPVLGFGIVSSASDDSHVWHTKDGSTWRRLTLPAATKPASRGQLRPLGIVGAALAIVRDDHTYGVDDKGQIKELHLSDEQRFAATLGTLSNPAEVERVGTYEGFLQDAGWILSGRNDHEWVAVRDRRLTLLDSALHTKKELGQPLGDEEDGCGPWLSSRGLRVACVSLRRVSVLRVDLQTGAATPEPGVEVRKGNAHNIGGGHSLYPDSLFIDVSCDGTEDGRYCTRNADGTWTTHAAPPKDGRNLPFEDDALFLRETPQGNYEMLGDRRPPRVYPSAEIDAAYAAMGVPRPRATQGAHSASGQALQLVLAGVMHAGTSLRLFHGSSPFEAAPAKPASFVMVFPFDPKEHVTVERVSGVVAFAGRRGLRLADGALWETADGWRTWTQVEPPPTGVPVDLAGAMCGDSGCRAGAWVRIGWQLP